MFERFTERAHLALDLARDEAEHLGHRYLGPEHILLGVLAEGHSSAARTLRTHGVELDAARSGLRGLADQGVVPLPQPSDAELLASLGIDLDAVRRSTEQAFGFQTVGTATWRVTRWRGWRRRTAVWTPLCGPPLVAKRALYLASQRASALGQDVSPEHVLLGVLEDAREPASKGEGAAAASAHHRPCRAARRLPGCRRPTAAGARGRPRPAPRCRRGPAWRGRAVSWRARLGFMVACLLMFGLIAGWLTWSKSSTGPASNTPATVTLAPNATQPAGLAVSDLTSIEQLQVSGLRSPARRPRGGP